LPDVPHAAVGRLRYVPAGVHGSGRMVGDRMTGIVCGAHTDPLTTSIKIYSEKRVQFSLSHFQVVKMKNTNNGFLWRDVSSLNFKNKKRQSHKYKIYNIFINR
jgi:hypothetical protein